MQVLYHRHGKHDDDEIGTYVNGGIGEPHDVLVQAFRALLFRPESLDRNTGEY